MPNKPKDLKAFEIEEVRCTDCSSIFVSVKEDRYHGRCWHCGSRKNTPVDLINYQNDGMGAPTEGPIAHIIPMPEDGFSKGPGVLKFKRKK